VSNISGIFSEGTCLRCIRRHEVGEEFGHNFPMKSKVIAPVFADIFKGLVEDCEFRNGVGAIVPILPASLSHRPRLISKLGAIGKFGSQQVHPFFPWCCTAVRMAVSAMASG